MDICWEDNGIDYDMAEKIMSIMFDFDSDRKNQQMKYKADIFPANIIENLKKDFKTWKAKKRNKKKI